MFVSNIFSPATPCYPGSGLDYATLASQLTLADAIAKIDELFGCEAVLKEFDADATISY
ncbi:MAG: hypothetical protein WCO29_13190 [Nostocales cyanobacterium ELA583]